MMKKIEGMPELVKTEITSNQLLLMPDSSFEVPELKFDSVVSLKGFEEKLTDKNFEFQMQIHFSKIIDIRRNVNLKVKSLMHEIMTPKLINEFSWTGKSSLNIIQTDKLVFQDFKWIIDFIYGTVKMTEKEKISSKEIKCAIIDCLRRTSV